MAKADGASARGRKTQTPLRRKAAPGPTPGPAKDEPIKRPSAKTENQLRNGARRLAQTALDALEGILEGDGQDSVRLAAAREVLDRGYGRTKLGGAEGKLEGAPYTVVVQRFGDPADPDLEDFD